MTPTTIALCALALWLITGTLMLATRDPLAFARMFWGLVTIAAWPVALWADNVVKKRRAKAASSTVIEPTTATSSAATAYRTGVESVLVAIRETALSPDTVLLDHPRGLVSHEVNQAEINLATAHAQRLGPLGDDPIEALAARTDHEALMAGFYAARVVVVDTLANALVLDEEGERFAVPLVGDLQRKVRSLLDAPEPVVS